MMINGAIVILLRLFYLVDPGATVFPTIAAIPNYIAEAAPLFFMSIAVEAAYKCMAHSRKQFADHGHRRPHTLPFALNDAVTSIFSGLIMQLIKTVAKNFDVVGYCWFYERFHFTNMQMDPNKLSTWYVVFGPGPS
jgi:hypothetical protein